LFFAEYRNAGGAENDHAVNQPACTKTARIEQHYVCNSKTDRASLSMNAVKPAFIAILNEYYRSILELTSAGSFHCVCSALM
jgi:hypothetical protein